MGIASRWPVTPQTEALKNLNEKKPSTSPLLQGSFAGLSPLKQISKHPQTEIWNTDHF